MCKVRLYGRKLKPMVLVVRKTSDIGETAERVELVFNVYKKMSLKQETRGGRSKGNVLRTLVRHDTNSTFKVPKVFSSK